MTAIPEGLRTGSKSAAALVIPGRASGEHLESLRRAAASKGLPRCLVLRSRGRQRGAPEALVAEILGAGVEVVIIPSLMVLHPSPEKALAIVGALLMAGAGVRVTSLAEAWVSGLDAATVASVSAYLVAAQNRLRSREGHQVIAAVRQAGRKIGRPAKPVDVVEAKRLVEQGGGYRAAGRALGVSASSVRRALMRAGSLNQGEAR